MQKNKLHPVCSILLIYFICFFFRGIEYLLIRTDQSFIGEAFIHKLAGIAVLAIALKYFYLKWSKIGFTASTAISHSLLGLLLGGVTFLIAYLTEFLVQVFQGTTPHLQFYVSAYAIEGNQGISTGILFIAICIIGNIINVIMEEGLFRGLFVRLAQQKYTVIKSMLLASFLFGIWHIAQPVRSFIDGKMALSTALFIALGYILTTFLAGFKYCMLTQLTGSLWTAMADHFVNNTIINMLHIVTATGADEFQFIRISIAQTISFIFVLILFLRKKAYKHPAFED